MKLNSTITLLIMSVMMLFISGCTTGIYDGKRVSNKFSNIRPSGWVTSAPQSGAKIRIQARNPNTGNWVTLRDNISISNTVSWTTRNGTRLYSWNAGNMYIPFSYWYNGTGGAYARVRAQWNICELGGFFGGHERYIRRIERHVMVYDDPWMPKGKIPAWNGSTWIPSQFQNAQVSVNGSCNSFNAGCSGWRSDAITDSTPNASKSNSVSPANVCSFFDANAVASSVSGWHASGHVNTGGHFATFDSPANPLFFLWHNAINDVWVDYRTCS